MSAPFSADTYDFLSAEGARSIWAAFTDAAGFPLSPRGCVILLALATSQCPSRVSAMDLRDVDFDQAVWWTDKQGRTCPLHLTRLASALIEQALSFRRSTSGTLFFPARTNPRSPMTTSLSRSDRRAIKDPGPPYRGSSDIPTIAAWIMAEAQVEPRAIRTVAGKLNRYDIRSIQKFYRFEPWFRQESRIALEGLEASLMRIAGLTYSDPIFRAPAGRLPNGVDHDPPPHGKTAVRRDRGLTEQWRTTS